MLFFFQFFFDFGLQVGPRPGHDSGGICLLRPPRASWRGCFGFVSLLASFWDHFGSTWSWILSLFRRILGSISLFFWHCFPTPWMYVCIASCTFCVQPRTPKLTYPGPAACAERLNPPSPKGLPAWLDNFIKSFAESFANPAGLFGLFLSKKLF